MKCPWCHDYSLTYDLQRHQYTCHTYNAVINAETMPCDRSQPILRLANAMWGVARAFDKIMMS